jgi:uncharacterized protein YbbK (DUF523 family)
MSIDLNYMYAVFQVKFADIRGRYYSLIMNFVKLVNSELSVDEISNIVSSPSCGAVSLFVGTTRDNFENKQVSVLLWLLSSEIRITQNPLQLVQVR